MNDLLNADCVIQHLLDSNIISLVEWKREHPNDQTYNIYFNRPIGLTSDIGINFIKRTGSYYVSRSLIKILSYRHRFNTDAIFRNCVIPA
jgi:hypothetical protein